MWNSDLTRHLVLTSGWYAPVLQREHPEYVFSANIGTLGGKCWRPVALGWEHLCGEFKPEHLDFPEWSEHREAGLLDAGTQRWETLLEVDVLQRDACPQHMSSSHLISSRLQTGARSQQSLRGKIKQIYSSPTQWQIVASRSHPTEQNVWVWTLEMLNWLY